MALGVVVRREQAYWKPEALASPLSIGAVSIPVIGFAFAPAWKLLKGILSGAKDES
jgi:hypothetical protein